MYFYEFRTRQTYEQCNAGMLHGYAKTDLYAHQNLCHESKVLDNNSR